MVTAAGWSHAVARAPAAVFIAVGLVEAPDIADSNRVAAIAALDGTGTEPGENQEPQGSDLPSLRHGAHCGSCWLSLSDHSINPTGAPFGSAMTANLPP
jgi:hypothetical protein